MRFDQAVVDDYLDAAHAVGDHLLETFHQACQAVGVPYFLTSGTLLGAVRSGGWIPWDDDVDVIMFREDYERLVPRISEHLPANVAFSSPETRADHITVIPRLLYLDSRRVHVGRHRSLVPIETQHMALDLFILDEGPRNARLRKAWSLTAHALDKVAVARYTSLRDVVQEPVIGQARKVVETVGLALSRVMSRRRWHALRTWLIRLPSRRRHSGRFVAVNYSTPGGRRMSFEKDWYLPAGKVEFSGNTYPAPGNPTAVLTELYGPAFLTPPDVGDRQPVHIRGGLEATLGELTWSVATGPEIEGHPGLPSTQPPEEPVDQQPDRGVGLDRVASGPPSFRRQVLWSMVARASSATLQVVVLVLLARGLEPSAFAQVITVNVALQVTVAVNGFGLLRQIEFRRSRDRDDPGLPGLFALRLRFSYVSAVLWLLICLGLYALTREEFALALLPAAAWLLIEQTTQVWNGIAVVDGRTHHLLGSYLTRRFPVVLFLAVALYLEASAVWAWTLGLAAGSFVSYAQGYRGQEPWARMMWPRRVGPRERIPFDLGYWWGLVGLQLRDFDVAMVAAVSGVAAGFYAFPARLVSPMNLVTVAAASSIFPRVARAGGLTPQTLRKGVTLGLIPVTCVALMGALCAPLLPVVLGDAYDGSVDVMRVTCVTAVLSGAATMIGIMLQAHSSDDARAVGYRSLGFAIMQIAAAGVGAALGGAVLAAGLVAVVNAALAATLYVRARRTVTL